MASPIVELADVKKVYPLGRTSVPAVRGVSFNIEKGDFISIAGPSGSGKTTILNLIGCIDTPSEGVVRIDGVETSGLADGEITGLRHRMIGFIFQTFNLIPVLNVFENIEFPLILGGGRGILVSGGGEKPRRGETRDWIDSLINDVGLTSWRTHKPGELSGGQRQRVAIARALVTKPRIVLADEPTANLDSATGESIIELMKKINRERQTTFIFSTHDDTIVQIADHVIRLHDGRVASEEKRSGRKEATHAAAR